MATIGFIPHPGRAEAVVLATSTAGWLIDAGHQAPIITSQIEPDGPGCAGGVDVLTQADGTPEEMTDVEQRREVARTLDLAVSLGGDGTMLRTVDLVAPFGVPVLGVNVGHLGFLTGISPSEIRHALSRFLAGEYRVEDRMTLAIEVTRRSGDAAMHRSSALNDAVLQRTSLGHTVQLAVYLSGTPFLTYAADSMIVATPTGSTAYNLSARGPIASPRTRVLVMTPVAAHMLFDRSLVLAEDEDIAFEVIGDEPVDLVVDGQAVGCLSTGDTARCRAGDYDARFVDFGGRDFHHVLKQKFGSADR